MWDVPEGDWVVRRLAMVDARSFTRVPPRGGEGLECDKLSKEAVQANFDGLVGKLLADNPKLAGHELSNEVRLRAGLSLYNLKKYAEAEKDFATVAKDLKAPFADFATLRRGQCLEQLKRTQEAAVVLAQFSQQFPKSDYTPAARLTAGRGQGSTGGPFSSTTLPSGSRRYIDGPFPLAP